jgi:hypothetical protein
MIPARNTRPCTGCGHRRRARRGLGALGDSTAGLPSGTQLSYSAFWQGGVFGASSASVHSYLAQTLPAYGIMVDSGSDLGWLTPGNGFTLQIHTTADRNAASDVKSVIDGLIYQGIKVMPQSTITTQALGNVAPPVGGSTTPGGDQQAQWLQLYNAAVAAGDSTTAAYYLQLIQGGASQPFNIGAFLTNNWGWLAAAAGGLFLVKEMS